MMDLAGVEKDIEKHLANILKLGKTETDNKTKATLLKAVAEVLKQLKAFEKTQTDLNKRIKETKTLSADIEKYQKSYTSFINDAVKLSAQVNKIDPDTKTRDYFNIADRLTRVGQFTLDPYP